MDINKLSRMAKLSLSEDEIKEIGQHMEALAHDLDRLSEVDTANVEPLIYATERTNVLRDDIMIKKITRESLLANAPEQANGCFKVPKTVE